MGGFKLVEVRSVGGDLVVSFRGRGVSIASTVIGGGIASGVKYAIFHRVDSDFRGDPRSEAESALRSLGLSVSESLVFLTAVDVTKYHVVLESSISDITVCVIVTLGLTNAVTVPQSHSDVERVAHYNSTIPHTINILAVTNRALSSLALVDAVKTVSEAKAYAMYCLDYRVNGKLAIGTSTDAIAIVSLGRGKPLPYAGVLTKVGALLSMLTCKAIVKCAEEKWGLRRQRSIIDRLGEYGIKLSDIVDAALELFIPHSSSNSGRSVREVLEGEVRRVLDDVNVASLVIAALKLHEIASLNLLPGMEAKEYNGDPVRLVADEILGLALALYLNGWNAVFEYYRYDTRKPGIISKLPPFVDDIVSALIGGVTSRIYSKTG
ncbi:MAG TPA: hypothetical protein EYH40_00970 [Desulfurococcales archaeon]|nr:hypothetical protein [Desulfurococcales archaeon]